MQEMKQFAIIIDLTLSLISVFSNASCISFIVGLIIGFIIGFIISFIIAFIIGFIIAFIIAFIIGFIIIFNYFASFCFLYFLYCKQSVPVYSSSYVVV